jgi:uncharacterized RDD family membrane protein YckC
MRCPSCGATYDGNSAKCTECQTEAVNDAAKSETYSNPLENPICETTELETSAVEEAGTETLKEWSSLIHFPGVAKSSVPQWRKDLSDRVREIQEQRAREAALAKKNAKRKERRNGTKRAPQLALLESTETPELNPIVAAALRRIDRAHKPTEPERTTPKRGTVAPTRDIVPRGQAVPAARVLRDEAPVPAAEVAEDPVPEQRPVSAEKIHTLLVVPPITAELPEKRSVLPMTPPMTTEAAQKPEQPIKPNRLIADDPNHSALNYLDSIAHPIQSENCSRKKASGLRRVLSAFVDLILIAFFSSPLVGGLYLIEPNWPMLMVIAASALVVLLVAFLYLTAAIALTGRTLGMRLLSLRVIDARTGLIPTGNQSAGRALLYLASLLSAGIALIYAVTDSERRPAHDRLTGTAVVRA